MRLRIAAQSHGVTVIPAFAGMTE